MPGERRRAACSRDDLSDEAPLHGVGLDHDECALALFRRRGQTAARAGPGERRAPQRQASPSAPEARVWCDNGAASRHGRQRRPARLYHPLQLSAHVSLVIDQSVMEISFLFSRETAGWGGRFLREMVSIEEKKKFIETAGVPALGCRLIYAPRATMLAGWVAGSSMCA